MSNLLTKVTENVSSADNQQETLQNPYYFTGFCCGEMSCSLIKASNYKRRKDGVITYTYVPDITISNADLDLLKQVNLKIGNQIGVITPIKGAYNLSFRGKTKTIKVLEFFDNYPPIVDDLMWSKLGLIKKALYILNSRASYLLNDSDKKKLELIRSQIKTMKHSGIAVSINPNTEFNFTTEEIGMFLSVVLDAEGSVGMKKNSSNYQPFIAIAMKERKVIEMFSKFLNCGQKIRYRQRDGTYHFEIGSKTQVLRVLELFLMIYPSQLKKQQFRMKKLQWILNDYTPGSL